MVLIIDANNMAYRALYTFHLSYKDEDTSVTYGMLRMIATLIHKYKPRSVVACFDNGVPAYRRELIPGYKARRKKDDIIDWDGVYRQIDNLCEYVLPIHGIMTMRRADVEADDLMYHAAELSVDEAYIVTTDNDLLHAIDERTAVIHPNKGIITYDNFDMLYDFPYNSYLMYKVLVGDSSDNIPGVPGIGPKTAAKLIREYDFSGCKDSPAGHKWVCLNIKQQKALDEFGEDAFWNAYDVMDLSVDRCGAKAAVLSADWKPANVGLIKKYYVSHGFASFLGDNNARLFRGLRRPEFDNNARAPTVPPRREPILWAAASRWIG